jgi:hypothetical protein
MTRVHVYYSDGRHRGGLLTLETCIGRLQWHAPPNLNYQESLVHYGDDCWFLVRQSTSPQYDRPESDTDAVDEASSAVRLSNADTLRWFAKSECQPPEHLLNRLLANKHVRLTDMLDDEPLPSEPCHEAREQESGLEGRAEPVRGHSLTAQGSAAFPAAPEHPRPWHTCPPDYSWLRVSATTYTFDTSMQRAVIQKLYECWTNAGEKDGCGLTASELQAQIGSGADRFRIDRLFKNHPAMNTILRRKAKGVWALFLGQTSSAAEEAQVG